MKQFFSSVKFKVLLCLLVLMAGFMAYAGAHGSFTTAPQQLLATALVPLQRFGAMISGGINGLRERWADADSLRAENAELKSQIDELRKSIVDYDDMKAENDLYRSYYQISDTYSSYNLVSAFVIGRDPLEKYYSFTIDCGTSAGIAVDDVVVTAAGVAGRVSAVGLNYAEVLTILDPQVSMGSTVSRTRDIGLAQGDSALSQNGQLIMNYLPRETLAAVGDLIVTTGLGGVFPAGLVVGTVQDILPERSGKSMYAVVAPTVDVSSVTSVFVITGYNSADSASGSGDSSSDAPAPPDESSSSSSSSSSSDGNGGGAG